jgi:hypothetical protein
MTDQLKGEEIARLHRRRATLTEWVERLSATARLTFPRR